MSGKPAARQGDMTQYGGSIVQGSAGVRIGAPTGVACSVCPGGVTSGHPVNPLLGAKVLPGETDIALTDGAWRHFRLVLTTQAQRAEEARQQAISGGTEPSAFPDTLPG
ncbi:hypothetical protein FCZ24_20325, partial [Escherichia coli]|nr:hypothetical protein [Escherichia coli]